jgi:hypothetical protein
MTARKALTIAALALLAALWTTGTATAATLRGERAQAGGTSAAACLGPCGMSFHRKGDGGGRIRVQDPSGVPKECRPDPVCFLTLDFPSDTGVAVIRVIPDPGYTLAGWENCPEQNRENPPACLVDVGDFLNTDLLCAAFKREVGGTNPATGCPPAGPPPSPQPPPPVLDTRPPNTRITSGPAGTTRSRLARFRFASTESRSTFFCRLDRGNWLPCRSPKTYRRLKPGVHTFRVRALDRAQNMDPSPVARRWRVRR